MNLDPSQLSAALQSLTWEQFAGLLVAVAGLDWLTGMAGAWLKTHTFSLDQALTIIANHGPTVGATAIVFAVGQLGNVPAVCGIADALFLVYLVQTLQSAGLNIGLITPPVVPPGP